MPFQHGKSTRVLADETDLSTFLTQIGLTAGLQTVNVTTFQNDDLVYLAGRGSGSVNTQGIWDGDAGAVDAVLAPALAAAPLVVSVSPQGMDTIGDRALLLSAREASYNTRGTATDAVRVSATFTADGGLRGGVVLHELAEETSPANFTAVDNGAATSFGGTGHLHVTAFSGTSATIKITDSTAVGGPYADLITFASVTGVGAERATVAGTVNDYTRVELTGTFTSITFAVCFARNQR